MAQLTITIPDDLAQRLEDIAIAQKKSLEQVALDRLGSLVFRSGSPGEILRAMKEPPFLSRGEVDELEAAIAAGRMPINENGAFDR